MTVDLEATCPHTLGYLVDKATEAANLRKLAGKEGLGHLAHGIILAPIQKIIGTNTTQLDRQIGGTLKALVTGGFWDQQRLFDHGYVQDPSCQACGALSGTLAHRL